MLKKLLAISLILLFLLSLLSACKTTGTQTQDVAMFSVDEHLSEAMLQPATGVSEEFVVPDVSELVASDEETTGEKDESKEEKETEEATTAEVTTAAEAATEKPASGGGAQTGTSSKGYAITQVDGIYYVDGVLIANKTYALPSSYYPGGLTSATSAAFEQMKSAAASEGLDLWVASGFRSYDTQDGLYNRYVSQDGKAAADRYSARPGHSEHQTGMAIDLNEISSSFEYTPEGQWVAANCYKYGFILRYPKGKEPQTGYMYEPWHVRYVGVDVATKIYNSGLCLEEYYGITSVYQ